MTSMPAYRVLSPEQDPQWCEVEVPAPGPGEVLIRLGGAGLCRTDLEVIDHGRDRPFHGPFTLGHENAGWVEASGPGGTFREGEAVVASTIKSCGRCRACLRGADNYCESMSSRGLREDGGLAPFMIADRRQLVPLGELHPARAAPLADAGLSALGAVTALGHLLDQDPRVAVVGVGGLGTFAVQFLRVLAPEAWVGAFDVDEGRLSDSLGLGADAAFLVGDDMTTADDFGRLDAVLDFVGSHATLAWAARSTVPPGAVVVCGRGGGAVRFGRDHVPPGVDFRSSRGGTVADLERAVRWAREGLVTVNVTTYDLLDAERAYDDLRHGRVRGRAVLCARP